jgi:signal transduction histidine kinase
MVASERRRPADGWATQSLENSIRQTFVAATGAWQLVMAAAALIDRSGVWHPTLLFAAHLAYAGLSLIVLRGRFPQSPFIVLGLGLIIGDLAASVSLGTVLAFAAVWMWNLFHLVPVMVIRGPWRWPIMVLEAFGMPFALYLVHPEWSLELPIAAVGTSLAMQTAGWVALLGLARLGRDVDRQAEHAAEERQAVEARRRSSDLARESARVLHDTMINTLGAIAVGGGATRDKTLVRARCERDIIAMSALGDGELDSSNDAGRSWSDLRLLGPVEFSSLGAEALDARAPTLPSEVAWAMRGIAQEAVLNALKHAGVETVVIDAQPLPDGGLEVVVTDHGLGMETGSDAHPALRASMLERAQYGGVAVDVRSAGDIGTSVLVRYEPDAASSLSDAQPNENSDVATIVLRIRRLATLAAAWGTAGVGVAIEVINQSARLTWTYATIGLLIVATFATTALVRRRDALPTGGAVALVLLAPVAYVLTLPAVDFGRQGAHLWQAITAAPFALLLLEFGRTSRLAAYAVGAIFVPAAVIAVSLWPRTPDAGAILIVGAVALAGVVIGWERFRRTMDDVSRRSARDFEMATQARIELAARRAGYQAMERWRSAGLHSALELLREIAVGDTDPHDATIRSRAADEEAFLRQLLMLSPDAVHMNPWFHRALAAAREGGIRVRLRATNVDAPDGDAAERLGILLREVLNAAQPGCSLSVTFGEHAGATRMSLVGSAELLGPATPRWSPPEGWRVNYQEFVDEAIVEVTE